MIDNGFNSLISATVCFVHYLLVFHHYSLFTGRSSFTVLLDYGEI